MINLVNLSNKKIMVTGASSGIGRETAVLLSKLGANLALVARNENELKKTMSMLDEGRHHYYIADLKDLDSISSIVEEAVCIDNQKLSGMVHCAGVSAVVPLQNLTYEKMDDVMKINYYAFIELVKAVSKKKNSDGGSIVAISSVAAAEGEKCQTIYSASKAAINASVRTLSFELVKKNIRINCVMPGLINTEMVNRYSNIADEQAVESANKQLLGMGEPTDVANLIAYLLSDAARFITGRSYYIDGGRF